MGRCGGGRAFREDGVARDARHVSRGGTGYRTLLGRGASIPIHWLTNYQMSSRASGPPGVEARRERRSGAVVRGGGESGAGKKCWP